MPRFDTPNTSVERQRHVSKYRPNSSQQPAVRDVDKSKDDLSFRGEFAAVIDAIRSLETSLSKPKVAPTALGLDAAAEYLGIKPNNLEYLVRTRKIRYVQVGKQRGRVFRIADLDEFLKVNTQLTANEMFRRTGRK